MSHTILWPTVDQFRTLSSQFSSQFKSSHFWGGIFNSWKTKHAIETGFLKTKQCLNTIHLTGWIFHSVFFLTFFPSLSSSFLPFTPVPHSWFQLLAWFGLRKPHSRLAQALAVLLTSKVQGERRETTEEQRHRTADTLAQIWKGGEEDMEQGWARDVEDEGP